MKAIMPVSLFGQMADYDEINRIAARARHRRDRGQGLQSFGAWRQWPGEVAGVTTISSTSFFPAKPLGCYGEGGALFTNDGVLADRIVAGPFCSHGGLKRHHHPLAGGNEWPVRHPAGGPSCSPNGLTSPSRWRSADALARGIPRNCATFAWFLRWHQATRTFTRNTPAACQSAILPGRIAEGGAAFPRQFIIPSACMNNPCSPVWVTNSEASRNLKSRVARSPEPADESFSHGDRSGPGRRGGEGRADMKRFRQ